MSEQFTQKVEEYITQLEEQVSRLAEENSDLLKKLYFSEDSERKCIRDFLENNVKKRQLISQLRQENETCRMELMNMENENHGKLMKFKQVILQKNNIIDQLNARYKELHTFTLEKLQNRDIEIQQLKNKIKTNSRLLNEFNNLEQFDNLSDFSD